MYDPEEACNENEDVKGDASANVKLEESDVEMAEPDDKVEVKEEPKPPATSTPRQTKAKRGRK